MDKGVNEINAEDQSRKSTDIKFEHHAGFRRGERRLGRKIFYFPRIMIF